MKFHNKSPESISIDLNDPNAIKKPNTKKKIIKLASIIILLILILSSSIYFAFSYFSSSNEQNPPFSILPIQEPTPTPTPEPIFYPNPYTGVLIPEEEFELIKERPVLAIMIQNNIASRPEYGLNQADVMYEALVESFITRFMGIYWSKESERVQSLRSARKYYVDLLGDYNNPVYMHIGYAYDTIPQADALSAMSNYGIRRIGDLRNRDNNELAYSRDNACERVKAIEHCAFTSTQRLWAIAKQQNWTNVPDINSKSWKFTNELPEGGKKMTDFTVHFRTFGVNSPFDGNYSVIWKYDPETNLYNRFNLDGTPYLDGFGEQVNTNTIIYQKVVTRSANDGKGRITQDVIGSGDASIMMGGKVYDVKWSKPNFATKTKFTNPSTGEEFEFLPGRQWIMLLPNGNNYIDNTPVATATPSTIVSN
jgi:hypothetical protein